MGHHLVRRRQCDFGAADRLADQRIGQVRLFIGSILLFVISSWLCGMAPTYRS